MSIPLLDKAAQLLRGQSYWRVKLSTGRTFSELDRPVAFAPDPMTGRMVARSRHVEWTDLVASGDSAHIKEVSLVTPERTVSLDISEPYTVFQLKRGTVDLFSGGRIMEAQIIGRVTNRETGACVAHIWDARHFLLVENFETNVRNFATWMPDVVIAPGALALEQMGVHLT